jgi:hypothetical protein
MVTDHTNPKGNSGIIWQALTPSDDTVQSHPHKKTTHTALDWSQLSFLHIPYWYDIVN